MAKQAPCETTAYALDVVAGKHDVCRLVRLACERHLRDLKRTDGKVWFDRSAADRFFAFCGFLRHYKGDYRGRPLDLLAWQRFAFGNIYGWKRIIDGEKTDILRFNYAYLEVPRKQGKSSIAAAVAAYDCAMLEKTGAEVYLAATKEDQAKIVFRDVEGYIKGSPDAAEMLEVLQGKSTVYARASGRTSFIRAIGANSDRLDGLNPFSVICDELHAWAGRALWDVLDGAFGARSSWHMIAITTAGSNAAGICWTERKHMIEVLEGLYEADNKFGVIYGLDEGEERDWKNPRLWAKANPSLGAGKAVEFMASQAQKAEQEPSALNAFLMKQLNVWTDAADAWLSLDDWRGCERKKEWGAASLAGKKVFGGMDLALVGDLSAVAWTFPVQDGISKSRLVVDFFVPLEGLAAREERDKVPYRQWIAEGWMTGTPGKTTDFEFIRAKINARAKTWAVESVAYDRMFAGALVQSLRGDGVNMVEHGQGFLSMGSPTAAFERIVVAGEIEHDGNPCLSWNAANCIVVRDPTDAIKPDKSKSQNRIDGIVAAIMTMTGALNLGRKKEDAVAEKQKALELMATRGMRFV